MFWKKKKIKVTGEGFKKMNWNTLSMQQYLDLQNLFLENEDKLEGEDLMMEELRIVYNKDPYTMPMVEFNRCIDELKFMSQPMPKMKIKDRYNLGGNIYYLHKKLEQFKVGQYIDYQRIMQNKKGIDAYPEFIALFLTPEEDGVYGDGYDVAQVIADIRKYMSIADATSIATFFLHSSKIYTTLSLWYSMWTTRKAIKNRKTRRLLRKKTMQLMNLVLNGD